MCGRLLLTATSDEVRRLFGYDDTPNFPARFNIAPTQPLAIVTNLEGRRRFLLVRWGLIPGWAKDPRDLPLLINARAETADEKPSFRGALRHRRMLVPASGFYEWRQGAAKTPKQPFLIRPRAGGLFALAGIWETYLAPDGSEIDTAAILTLSANLYIGQIHDRMPAVVQPTDFARWLDCRETSAGDAMRLIPPVVDDYFEAIPISTRVNAVKNDDEGLIVPLAEPLHLAGDLAKPQPDAAGDAQRDLFGEPLRRKKRQT